MSKVKTPPPAKSKNLVQQNADFTDEGSPPPGRVATEVPASGPAVVAPLKPPAAKSRPKKY